MRASIFPWGLQADRIDMSNKPKIGLFVTGFLEDEYNKTGYLRPKFIDTTKDLAKTLSAYGEIVDPGFIEYEPDAERAAHMFNAASVDLIVVVALAYQTGTVPARMFLNTRAPILVWNTQHVRHFPEDANFDVIMLNSGMCGLPELTNGLLRAGRSFRMITSHVADSKGLSRIGDYANAAGVVSQLKNARIGIIGHSYAGMTDLMIDQYSLRHRVGPVCLPIEPEKVAVAAAEISAESVKAIINEEKRRYHTETLPSETFERSIRLALALEKVVKDNDLNGLATFEQAWLTDSRVGIVANYGAGRLSSLGVPSVPEGDVATAVSMLVLQGLTGQSTIMENYVMDFDNNTIMLSHDGTGNPALATSPSEVSIKPSIYYRGVNGFGAAFEFAYAPGDVTLLSLILLENGQWRFIAAEGESLPMKPRPLSAPQMTFRHSSGSLEEYCDQWCSAGASHHMALAYGKLANKVRRIGELLDIEVVTV
jgi:L-arabinose isomerase